VVESPAAYDCPTKTVPSRQSYFSHHLHRIVTLATIDCVGFMVSFLLDPLEDTEKIGKILPFGFSVDRLKDFVPNPINAVVVLHDPAWKTILIQIPLKEVSLYRMSRCRSNKLTLNFLSL